MERQSQVPQPPEIVLPMGGSRGPSWGLLPVSRGQVQEEGGATLQDTGGIARDWLPGWNRHATYKGRGTWTAGVRYEGKRQCTLEEFLTGWEHDGDGGLPGGDALLCASSMQWVADSQDTGSRSGRG